MVPSNGSIVLMVKSVFSWGLVVLILGALRPCCPSDEQSKKLLLVMQGRTPSPATPTRAGLFTGRRSPALHGLMCYRWVQLLALWSCFGNVLAFLAIVCSWSCLWFLTRPAGLLLVLQLSIRSFPRGASDSPVSLCCMFDVTCDRPSGDVL